MKKSIQFLSVILFLCNTSFGQAIEIIETTNDYNIAKIGNKMCVFVEKDDYIVPPESYTNIEYDWEYDFFKCYKGKEFSIIKTDKNIIESDYLFTDISKENEYSDDLYRVESSQGIGYVENNKILLAPIYDEIEVESELYIECCVNYILTLNGKKGLFVKGKMILEPIYDDFYSSSSFDGTIRVEKDNMLGLMCLGSYSEQKPITILKPIYSSITQVFDNGDQMILEVEKDEKRGVFVRPSEITYSDVDILEKCFFKVEPQYEKLIWKKLKEIDLSGPSSFLLSAKKEGLLLFCLKKDNEVVFAEELITNEYRDAPIGIVNKEGKYQLILENDCLSLGDELFDMIDMIEDELVVQKNGLWAFYRNKEFKYKTTEALHVAYENGDY